jgi:hypothetical protein
MLAMGLIHTFPAEQSVEKAGAFQANVLYLLIVVGFSMDADSDVILVAIVHGSLRVDYNTRLNSRSLYFYKQSNNLFSEDGLNW